MNCKRILSIKSSLGIFAVAVILVFIQTRAVSAEQASHEFQNDTMTLLQMTGAANLGLQMGTATTNQIIDLLRKQDPDIPQKAVDAIKDEISKLFAEEISTMLDAVVPIYAKHFSHEELKGLISFYKTTLGQKTIKVLPQIMNESMLAGQVWGKSLEPKLRKRLSERLKAEGFEGEI